MIVKIALIHGQNHKGSSYHIGRMIADKIKADSDITEFFLPRDLEHFCKGCCLCIEDETKCPFYAEKKAIMQVVEQADILIFTTPTYCMRASAPTKSFIDLTFTYWLSHKPRVVMFSKKAVVVSTAAGAGMKSAVKDISNTLFYWGVPYVERYGIAVQAAGWDEVSDKKKAKIEKDTTRLAKRLVRKKPKAGIKLKFMFHIMRMMQKGGMGAALGEKEYWQANGWLDKKRPWQ